MQRPIQELSVRPRDCMGKNGRRRCGGDGWKYDIVDSFCYLGDTLSLEERQQ